MEAPRPIIDADLSKIKGLCFDVDDTFSTHGKITDEAFTALWNLRRAGYVLIPVTGRPAGWCDHIARFWPVDAVVGENGAFSMFMYEGMLQRFETLGETEATAARTRLQGLADAIVRQFPGVQFASDQNYREYDIAIDFCEDVTPWPDSEIERLVKFCELKGAIAKISSIHVNTWFGRYTKIEGIRKFLSQTKEQLNLPTFEEFAFAGDSPNDEPMFGAFANSIGVQNVKPFLPKMKVYPKFITNGIAGSGFAEIARALLK